MDDCAVVFPLCTEKFDREHVYGWPEDWPDYSFGDCGSEGARFFFFFLKIICESVMLNLFIGVVLSQITISHTARSSSHLRQSAFRPCEKLPEHAAWSTSSHWSTSSRPA